MLNNSKNEPMSNIMHGVTSLSDLDDSIDEHLLEQQSSSASGPFTPFQSSTDPSTPSTPVSPVSPTQPDSTSTDGTVPLTRTRTESEIREEENPTIRVLGVKYDLDTIIVNFSIIAVWIAIWWFSGLYRTLQYDPAFFLVFFLFASYMLINVASAGTTSGGVVYELNILLNVEQMISILFGSFMLFVLFNQSIPYHDSCRTLVFNLAMSVMMILATSSMWVNVVTSGRAFRFVRKLKQGIYNASLSIFVLILMIMLKANPCGVVPSPSTES
jgi:hypothetical protein